MASAAVKEEPEATYSLSLLLTDRKTTRCRAMTASSLGGHPPPPAPVNPQSVLPQTPVQGCGILQNNNNNINNNHLLNNNNHSNHQQVPVNPGAGAQQGNNSVNPPPPPPPTTVHPVPPQVNGIATFDKVSAHSPSNMPTSESTKRNPSPNKPPANDPLSHRIIEKRRRDRMNNCLADLSRLIPTYYLKKGRGRIEKTEIIEMAIKYMKHLQAHACNQIENCEVTTKQERTGSQLEQYHLGYQECLSETMQFLVESEGFFSGDSLCVRLMNHLSKHCEKILSSEGYITRQSGASSSTSSGYHANSSSTGSSSDGNGNGSSHASESKDTLVTEESAYRSDDRPGSDDREEKPGSASMDSNSGMGSQLREILQQHSGPGGSVDRRCGYSSGLSSNNSSSGDDSVRLYKFKSNMKHRFSADLEQSHQVRKKRRDSESSCGNYTDCEKDRITPTGHITRPTPYQDVFPNDPVKMLDGHDSPPLGKNSGTPSPTPKFENIGGRNSPTRNQSEGPGGTIPIFALNQNGSFYVPLTIDYALVAPAMSNLMDTSPILHPVSIYVNFCCPSPAITANIGSIHPPNFVGTQAPPSHIYPSVGLRPSYGGHPPSLHHFESVGHNGRFPSRVYNERKRRDAPKQASQFEDQRTNHCASDNIEKRDPGEMEMREYRDIREVRDIREHPHHHVDHPPRELSREPTSCHDHNRDVRDQEQIHEVREVRNLRTIRDLREAREVREIRDPVQTVREFIDANNTCPNNTVAYSRTHPHWASAYHIQSKN